MSEEPQLPPTLNDTNAEMIRTFSNPVCKQTYNSLPRIYGKKKKNIRSAKSPNNHGPPSNEQSNAYFRHYYSANEDHHSNSAVKKKQNRERSAKLSQPKIANQCSRKNCSCKQHLHKTKSKNKTARRVLLPEIRKFELEDLESQHKVSMNGLHSSKASSSSGLQKIIEQQQQMRGTKSIKFHPNNQNKTAKSFHRIDPGQDDENQKTNTLRKKRVESMADQKQKHRFKATFNSKFDIEEESQEEKGTDELKNKNPVRRKLQATSNTGRYKTDINDSQSPKSNNSISLSSFVFKGVKRVNTKFHDLNQSQKNFNKKPSRQGSQLSNGLFRIPEEPEYTDYLNHHNPLNQNFTVKKLIKQPNFKIIRSDDEVYFGGVDDQERKHGTGLNITQKQIFEGNYDKNVKIQGCERNIDGVYEGGFQNGLRSGFGTFKWNNGQIFEGNWENGMKNGTGTWKSPKGDSYIGMWKNNRQEGKGVFKHRMSTYSGQFKNFLKHGYGEEKFANGDIYKGNYQQGKPHGKGRYEWKEGGYYEGDFVQGMREGRGKWVDANGTIYEGLFKQDFKHGFGKEWYSSGERYEGQFVEGSRTKGTLYEKNGNFIEVGR